MVKTLLLGVLLQMNVSAEVDFSGNANIIKPDEVKQTEVPLPQPTKSVKPKTQKEWTIMVYLNAKNDLEPFGIADMNEMETVGSNDYFNIVVEFGRIKGYDSSNGDWTGVRRYYVTKDNDKTKINSQLIADLGEVDMGNYKELINFAKWAKQNYPAKKYLLVIWNHGSGWEKGMKEKITKGVSYDEASGNHINTPQLGLAMKEIGKVDVIDFDACLMQMAEVGYEIRNYVTYIVASEETEPGDGDSYDIFLSKLSQNPTMGPLELAKSIVDAYYSHYSQVGEGTTKSVIRAEQFAGLLDAVNNFAYSISKAGDKSAVQKALDSVQSFAIDENKDLYHFAKLVQSYTTNTDVKSKAQTLMDFIKNKLVAYNKTTNGGYSWWGSSDYSNAYGVAIYIPSSSIASGYTDLQWAKYSNWDEFLSWYIGKNVSSSSSTTSSGSSNYPFFYNWLFGE
jgi:hypothetical protein